MVDIKKCLKRIESVLLVLGGVGIFGIFSVVAVGTLADVDEDFISYFLLIPICFMPYITYKFIYWIVIEVKDEKGFFD